MRILFAATEAAPWVKVGGLGDVIGSLPRALRAHGVDARIVLPAHAGVLDVAPSPRRREALEIAHSGGVIGAEIFETELEGVPALVVAGPPIDRRGPAYSGYAAHDGHRFSFFSRAVTELCRRGPEPPDLLHCHDWHTALASGASPVPSLLTVHNLPYTGAGAEAAALSFGFLPAHDARVPQWLRATPLGIGLCGADRISTVSEGYAREIQTEQHGHGFDALLRARGVDGVLNGLDLEAWNPATDPALAARYGPDDLAPREVCRAALLQEIGLARGEGPLIAVVSRLVHQKGVDLAIEALHRLRGAPFRAVFLGTGAPELEARLRELAASEPSRIHVAVRFDADFARRIYSGADLMLLPSRYEPCGMTQMIAMRYGAIPVATETGGLADTVRDAELHDAPTGFLCSEPSVDAVVFGLRRALRRVGRQEERRTLMVHGMRTDFGWSASAQRYQEIYRAMITRRRAIAGGAASE